ncbi:hypothetical protein GV791_32015, partial [Nocardia cyriacigeorgica]
LTGSLRYATDLFDATTIESLTTRFLRVLAAVSSDPDVPVGEIELLDAAERSTVVHHWNDTAHPLASDETLAGLFAEQAARTPDAPAVTFDGPALAHQTSL